MNSTGNLPEIAEIIDEDKETLLNNLTDEDLDKEPARVDTEILDDETKIEKLQRYFCYMMILFGFGGGFVSFIFTSTTILDVFK